MLVIYHADGLDGACAAAIIIRASRIHNKACRISGTFSYQSLIKDLALDTKGASYVILDLDPTAVPNLKEYLSKAGSIAYWNAHTSVDPKTMALLKENVNNVHISQPTSELKALYCSAELAAIKWLPNDNVAKELGKIAHDHEFWLKLDERSQKLNDILLAGTNRREFVEQLSRGAFWSSQFENIRNNYLRKKKAAFKAIPKNVIHKRYLSYNFGFILVDSFLDNAEIGDLLFGLHSALDIIVCLKRNGSINFRRRNNCDVNCKQLASLFGGGGQTYAATGYLKIKITNNIWEKTLFDVDQKIKTHLLSL